MPGYRLDGGKIENCINDRKDRPDNPGNGAHIFMIFISFLFFHKLLIDFAKTILYDHPSFGTAVSNKYAEELDSPGYISYTSLWEIVWTYSILFC